MDEETSRWVAFSVFPGIGPVRFKLLLEYFGSAKAAWEAPLSTLKKIRLGEKLSDKFDHFRHTFDSAKYIDELRRLHVSVLISSNPRYPELLKQIPDPPFVLYVKGTKVDGPINMKKTIGVVGTRKITPYGRDVTRRITEGLVSYGFTIVSGLAYGVDACAHQSAIDAGGKTIAVLGCGIDIIAPPSNENLYKEIASGHGAIVSEMPLGLRPNKGLFPARNRIISGLSLGVVVTEGADDSGALITARNAGEQGREVFAVPGPITSPYSRGPSKLLKNGATLVESADDIVEALGISIQKKTTVASSYVGESDEEKKILSILTENPGLTIDELVRMLGLTVQQVSATITILELHRVITRSDDKLYLYS